ncbi:hypothetical protein [Mammaliicoccus lentus]|uniref:hypothetical protein n=1 Tax=Mammaliicoccus lentus TaxID=42858 RepID=UPI002DB59197|nr:hypothetical protein [Mammaliicoccus lentus]MEB8093156.1 hypothetical protein [Mammaliicoccus lentus]
MREIKSHMYKDGQQLFSINREEIEEYLQDDEFDGFAIISNLVENRIEIRRRNKPIKIDGTERE